METENLLSLGLNKNEAIIYLVLLELGQSQAGEISKKAQINRTTVYDTIERLIEKGLVKYSISSNKKIFKPVNPEIIVNQLREKVNLAEEVLPSLKNLYQNLNEKEDSAVYKGRKGIRSVFEDILNYKEYVAFGSSGKIWEVMGHDFIIFQKKKKKLKIKSRVIQSEEVRKNMEFRKVVNAEFRYLPNEFSIPITIIVYGINVAIMTFGEIPVASVITSKQVSKSFINYFELLWRIAKK